MTLIKKSSVIILTALLTACGSSDESSGTGYVQMYNASSNSPNVYLEIDDVVRTGAGFGQVTTRHNYNNDDYELNYLYINDNDDYIALLDDNENLSIKSDVKHLKVLAGDYNQPQIKQFEIAEFDKEDKFQLAAINTVASDKEYDLYLAKDDYDFVDAELITTTSYLELPELNELTEDNYTFYVTLKGDSNVLFQSSMVNFDDEETYVVMIRPSFSAEVGGIILDIVSDASSVTSLTHVDAKSQMRFYNAIDEYANVSFKAISTKDEINTDLVSNDIATEYHSVNAGTFTLSMLDSSNNLIVSNYVEAVNKNISLLSIFYQHSAGYPAMISVTEDLTPNEVSHKVEVVNLIDTSPFDTNVSEVDIYFTEGNETIEDTTSYIKDIDAFETKSLYLDSQNYDLTITYQANNQTISILQLADLDFSHKGNYILILEEDYTQSDGYKVTLLNTLAL